MPLFVPDFDPEDSNHQLDDINAILTGDGDPPRPRVPGLGTALHGCAWAILIYIILIFAIGIVSLAMLWPLE